MQVCAVCGYKNSEAFKFCPDCGAAAAAGASERRRVVTVLFCDLVGSTALGESSDPEVLRPLLARYYERMKAIVELQQPRTVYRQAITDWGIEAAAVDGVITAYFGRGDTWQSWTTLREGTKRFLELTSVPETRERNEKWLCGHLGAHLSNLELRTNLAKHCNKHHFSDERSFRKHSFVLSLALEDVRDGVTLDIVETPAAGFRHSPWSLG